MTTPDQLLNAAYQRTGLSFMGMTLAKAMDVPAIRISLECAAKVEQKKKHGKRAPFQPSLI